MTFIEKLSEINLTTLALQAINNLPLLVTQLGTMFSLMVTQLETMTGHSINELILFINALLFILPVLIHYLNIYWIKNDRRCGFLLGFLVFISCCINFLYQSNRLWVIARLDVLFFALVCFCLHFFARRVSFSAKTYLTAIVASCLLGIIYVYLGILSSDSMPLFIFAALFLPSAWYNNTIKPFISRCPQIKILSKMLPADLS